MLPPLPFLASATGSRFALDLLMVLACAGAVAMLFGRLKLAAIPGYLLAGVLIGPGVLGLVSDAAQIEQISGVAMIVLMFGIGLHMDTSMLRRGGLLLVATATAGTLLVTLALSPVLAAWTGSWRSGTASAMAYSMSSTAVVLRILQQRREMTTSHGRLSFANLLVQDMLAIVFLAVIPLLAMTAPDNANAPATLAERIGSVSLGVGGIAAMIVFGKLIMPRVLDEAARSGGGEVLLVVSAAAALGAGVLTAAVGLSPELGAFTAGFLLSGTRFRYQLSGQLTPLRDLFMAVFFTTIGLRVDLAAIAPVWWLVPIGVVVLPAIKALVLALSAWAMGTTPSVAGRSALELGQGGEFSLVLLGAAMASGVVDDRHASVLFAIVIGTLILTPGISAFGRRIELALRNAPCAPWVRRTLRDDPEPSPDTPSPEGEPAAPARAQPVIIAGYGPVGRACAERVTKLGAACTIIELNPRTVAKQSGRGHRVIYGDASNPEVLDVAGIHHAAAVVLALPDAEATLRAVRTIRSLHPSVYIAARTNYLSQAALARELGASHVTVEEVATAAALSDAVSARLRGTEGQEPPRSSTPL